MFTLLDAVGAASKLAETLPNGKASERGVAHTDGSGVVGEYFGDVLYAGEVGLYCGAVGSYFETGSAVS